MDENKAELFYTGVGPAKVHILQIFDQNDQLSSRERGVEPNAIFSLAMTDKQADGEIDRCGL